MFLTQEYLALPQTPGNVFITQLTASGSIVQLCRCSAFYRDLEKPVLHDEAGVACDLSWRISRLTGPTGQPQERDQRRPPDWQRRPIADHRVTVMMPSWSSPVERRGILQPALISPHKLRVFSIMTAGKASGSR